MVSEKYGDMSRIVALQVTNTGLVVQIVHISSYVNHHQYFINSCQTATIQKINKKYNTIRYMVDRLKKYRSYDCSKNDKNRSNVNVNYWLQLYMSSYNFSH